MSQTTDPLEEAQKTDELKKTESATFTRENTAVTTTQKSLEALYLEFANDFLTIERFAEYHSIPYGLAEVMLGEGKLIHMGQGCLY